MYPEVTISSHLFVRKEHLKRLQSARERLTIESKYDGEAVELFQEYDESFGIPLHYYKDWSKIAKKVQDIRMDGSKVPYNFTSQLRPGQLPLIERFEELVTSGGTGFILEAPPGFGKTVVMIKMIQMLQRSALVVVPRSNLVRQWIERFLEHSSLNESQIGYVNGNDINFRHKPVVIGLVHSLGRFKHDHETEFTNLFGTVVFDEVDRSVPPATFAPVVGMFSARYRIGASATVKRQDGMHEVFEHHVGQHHLRGEDVGRMQPKVLIHEFPYHSGYVHWDSPKLNRRGMLISRVSTNQERNDVIANFVKLIYNSGRRLVVLSDRTEQLMLLRSLVAEEYGIPKRETGLYVRAYPIAPGSKKKKTVKQSELQRIASACKVIFATYGMMGIGTDIPDLAGLIYATPQSQIEQSKGRIERMCENKKQPVIVDIVDMAYEDSVNWGRARYSHYKKAGLKIKRTRYERPK